MPPTITVLLLCDADPDRPDYGGRRFDEAGPLSWRGLREGVPRLLREIEGIRDGNDRPLPILWLVRADEQIAVCHDDPAWALCEFSDIWDDLQTRGHTLGWHPHHWRWADDKKCWYQETTDDNWLRANLELGAGAFAEPPPVSRLGWYAMNETTMNALDDLGVQLDLSAMPGLERRGGIDHRGACFVGEYDWSRCKRGPYRPHSADYQSHDVRPTGVIELPLTTIDSAAVRAMYSLRYRLRGGGGIVGRFTSINITAHAAIFSLMNRHVLAEAKERGHASLIAYFHPDELLGLGPALVDRPMYHARHVGDNLRRLREAADEGGVRLEFIAADEWARRLQEKFHAEAEAAATPVFEVKKPQLARAAKLAQQVFTRVADDADFGDRFRWKHTVVSVKGPWILAAGQKKAPVGHYPSLALRTWFFGREVMSAHSCDTAVAASEQGKGLLGRLARRQYDRLRDKKFAFAWAFPNARIFPIRTKSLAWKEVASFPFLLRPLDAAAVLTGAVGEGVGSALGPLATAILQVVASPKMPQSALTLAPAERFGAAADRIWDEAKERFKIAVVRDAEALNRRYVDAPGADYRRYHVELGGEVVGIAVARLMPKRGLLTFAICELLLPESHLSLAGDVVASLLQIARDNGAQAAGALCFSHWPEYRAFTAHGFVPVPTRLHPEPTYFTVYPLVPGEEMRAVFDAKNWYLSWGDQDTV